MINIENDRGGYQEVSSDYEAYRLKKHGLTRSHYIAQMILDSKSCGPAGGEHSCYINRTNVKDLSTITPSTHGHDHMFDHNGRWDPGYNNSPAPPCYL